MGRTIILSCELDFHLRNFSYEQIACQKSTTKNYLYEYDLISFIAIVQRFSLFVWCLITLWMIILIPRNPFYFDIKFNDATLKLREFFVRSLSLSLFFFFVWMLEKILTVSDNGDVLVSLSTTVSRIMHSIHLTCNFFVNHR